VTDLRYSDGIAAACTMIVLEANPSRAAPAAFNRLAARPLLGDDLRGTSLRGANLLVPFHEMYAVRSQDNHLSGLQHVSYVPFVSHARERATGELAHRHWFTYMEDHAAFLANTAMRRSPTSPATRCATNSLPPHSPSDARAGGHAGRNGSCPLRP
jgi:hypothetical protein